MDIAAKKNGKPNPDVKKIWFDSTATSSGIKIPQPGPYPAVTVPGHGVF